MDTRALFPDDRDADAADGDRDRDRAVDLPGTPLAERMRPRALDELVGQDAVVGPAGFLRRAIADDRVPSLILWGPPGSGKTTLAHLIAGATQRRFVALSAVTSGIKEAKRVMDEAASTRRLLGRRTLLFLDEIHRFNRAQQDAFLPYVERGDVTLVGATTENPSFEVVGALLSRCRVVVLEPLAPAALIAVMTRALGDDVRGLGALGVAADTAALQRIADLADGDARRALTLLEMAALDAVAAASETASDAARAIALDAAAVTRVAQRKILHHDKAGDGHYDLISALHKSLRESDADASLYWLGRMLAAGDDPHYVARRLVRFASEDIGLADPRALDHTLAAWDAYHRLGSPEGDLALSQAVVYLALAPKSNAVYAAHKAVRRAIETRPVDPVPRTLRNAPTRLMKELGHGRGYVYAHDTDDGIGGLDCLPEALAGTRFYRPSARGVEIRLGERMAQLEARRAAARARRASAPADTDD
ncbi:MAG: replication-associated recombination protein A [Acidobacteriota bacterium]